MYLKPSPAEHLCAGGVLSDSFAPFCHLKINLYISWYKLEYEQHSINNYRVKPVQYTLGLHCLCYLWQIKGEDISLLLRVFTPKVSSVYEFWWILLFKKDIKTGVHCRTR